MLFLSGIQTLKRTIVREMFSGSIIRLSIAGAAAAVISLSVVETQAQGPAASGTVPAAAALKTPWGEPDLQGIWTDETDTPFQRSPKFANHEFFTEAQRAELDRLRSASLGREKRFERGTEADVAGAYNDVFKPKKRTGVRTSRIVDPTNGRLPPMTPEAPEDCLCRTRVSRCAVAGDRNLQEQGAGMCRGQVRSRSFAALCGTSSTLQPRGDESP
jgi:hypothetical protein